MKPFPWKCGHCRERAVNLVTLDAYTADLEHDGRKYRVSLADFQLAQCEKCGSMIFDDAANRRLSDALRSEVGLLHPMEIRAQREALGLTQKALAAYLQIAEATLSRWAPGAQNKKRAKDQLLRIFFEFSDVRQFLGVPKEEPRKSAEPAPTSTVPDLRRNFMHNETDPQQAGLGIGYSTFTPVSVHRGVQHPKATKETGIAA